MLDPESFLDSLRGKRIVLMKSTGCRNASESHLLALERSELAQRSVSIRFYVTLPHIAIVDKRGPTLLALRIREVDSPRTRKYVAISLKARRTRADSSHVKNRESTGAKS
jgi:hypothetical protein